MSYIDLKIIFKNKFTNFYHKYDISANFFSILTKLKILSNFFILIRLF